MSEYTPTTGEIREFIEAADRVCSSYAPGSAAEAFDRWLAAHDAVVRGIALAECAAKHGEWEAEQGAAPDVAALREARAETWDEAIETVFAWWSAPEGERPALIVNPYGVGMPVEQEDDGGH